MAGLLDNYGGMRLSDLPLNRQPKTKGLLNMLVENPKTLAGLIADFTPVVGDVKSAYDGVQSAREGDWLGAGLGALGALPFVPNMGGVIKAGNNGYRAAESAAGYVGGHSKDGIFRISTAQIDEAQRGKGEGLALYRELVDDALARGEKVTSDKTVEIPAARVYEALKRRGYNVKDLPRGELPADTDLPFGAYFGRGNGPVYEITK